MSNTPINVLLATGLYPPDIGGPATYAKMLTEELPRRGFSVEVFSFGEVRGYPKIIRHAMYAWHLYTRSRKADLIYALDPVSVGLPTRVISRLTRTPYMVRLGGDYAWEQGQRRFGLTASLDEYTENRSAAAVPVRLLAAVQSFVVTGARRVVVPSEYMKRIVATWLPSSERLVRMYSVLHPLMVEAEVEQLRTQLEYTSPTIVTAGRLVPWKGMDTLVAAMPKILETYPDATLVIIGDGAEEAKLKQLANDVQVSASVRFTGSLSKAALGAAVKAANVFVLNTSYEGLSHQLLEVMDLNVPVVTTDVGGNPELIVSGETGLLVPYNDEAAIRAAIAKILDDETLASNLTAKAKARCADFARESVMDELAKLLRDVTKQPINQ